MVNLFAPGPHDPRGIHDLIQRRINPSADHYDLPPAEPLTLASYVAGPSVEVFLEHLAEGASLPTMLLFLSSERYIDVPLETTYQAAYRGFPAFWRDVLEGAAN